MSAPITFWVEGQPVAYSRDGARFSRTPARNVAWRRLVQLAYREAAGPGEPTKQQIRTGGEFWGAHSACDIDNLIKEIHDALNGLAYEDDDQISEIGSWKIADWRPHGVRAKRRGPRKMGALVRIEVIA